MTTELHAVRLPAKATQRYSIIWLHGLGADGHDFEDIVPELHLKAESAIEFIFPHAPVQPVTVNGGMAMRAWYDIIELSIDQQIDTAGIYQSAGLIEQFIAEEIAKGIPSEHILLAGFSQGGLIALHTALRYPLKLAGVLALSTYYPLIEQLKNERAPDNNSTPIFMAHGILDSVVEIEIAKSAYNALHTLGYAIEWHDYLMEHSVCGEEIHRIAHFINSIFND